MGDEELRALERRWHETGEVEDEARWHVARVRAGALAQERLDLAVALGVPAALVAAGRRPRVRPPGSPAGLRAWLGEVVAHDDEVQRRVAVAVAGVHLSELQRARRARGLGFDDPEGRVLRAGRAWLEVAARRLLAPEDPDARGRADVLAAVLGPRDLPALALGDDLRAGVAAAMAATAETCDVADWWRPPRAERVATLHAALVGGLGPWALGLRDPLVSFVERTLERVEVVAPCPMSWERLAPTADPAVRRCAGCRLDVVDLSALPRTEAEARLEVGRRTGGLCVTLARRPDGRLLTAECVAALANELPRPRSLTLTGMTY